VNVAGPSRRERVRAATVEEIISVARHLLVKEGPGAVTLRAIAREMGMTAPALYRYFPSLEELVGAVCAALYHEVSGYLERARDQLAGADAGTRMYAVCRAFREWSAQHPAEFALIFGSPLPGPRTASPHDAKHQAGMRLAGVFGGLFAEIWTRAPFPVPADGDIAPDLRAQLAAYRADVGLDLPLGALQVFLSCWIRLYGTVTMEIFGHLAFALTDAGPMFEAELDDLARLVGVRPA
jgi:AcrR family transcriptional regulator